MSRAFTQAEVLSALQALPGWAHENNKIQKTYVFNDFKEALSFIVRVGLHADQQDHHPELFNVYNRVEIVLTTHDAGNKVTEKDVKLARAIESFVWV